MQRLSKQQWLELGIYEVLWFAVFLFPLLGAYWAVKGGMERGSMYVVVCDSWLNIAPFFMLFLLNNYGLVPFLLFKKRYWQYILSLVAVTGVVLLFVPLFPIVHIPKPEADNAHAFSRNQMIEMREKVREKENVRWKSEREQEEEAKMRDLNKESRTHQGEYKPQEPFMKNVPYPFPPFAVRYLIHFLTAILMVGFNIAIKLFFNSLRDNERLKELENQHLHSELQYLKYQINPHFFMNTLNNIHALVDINTGKAKNTIMELSKLMRYVLYEASQKTILLSREIQFLENYIALMRLRFIDKVNIETSFPTEVPEVQIPPLLFISFVENAFKHGVSYRTESFISVCMKRDEANSLSFRCTNSNGGKADEQQHGIGLENIRKRLRLLFGNEYTLSITEDKDKFEVLLVIPLLI